MTDPGTLATELVFVGAIVLLLLRRAYSMVVGAPVSIPRLVAITVVYVVLFAAVVFASIPTPPWYSALLDLAVLVATSVLAIGVVEDRVEVERRPDGKWIYRLPMAVPVAYVVLFVLRLSVNLFVIGEDPFVYPPPTIVLTPVTTALVVVVDALFSFSAGLIVARTVAVYRVYQRRLKEASGPGSSRRMEP
jgi:UDP-N-acetylmuramyl pentapeptide phosphotransferase/UDP-N-acetylglucosamine-1-phosphate transferase